MAANVIFADDPERQEKFLAALATTGLKYKSAAAVGVAYQTVQNLRKNSIEFAEAMLEAQGQYADSISKEVYRRGVTGWEEPVYYKGEVVGDILKFDGKLLELEAKAARPDYYRENIRIEGNVTSGVLLLNPRMTLEEWEEKYGPDADTEEKKEN